MPELTDEQSRDPFELWRDRYRAREEAEQAETCARIAKLCEERDALITKRGALSPDQRSRLDARLAKVARMICELYLGLPLLKKRTPPTGKLGEWVSESPAMCSDDGG